MKTRSQSIQTNFIHLIRSLSAPVVLSMALASPLAAQQRNAVTGKNANPPSAKKNIAVMVEMAGQSAAVPYAEALKVAQAQADAARNAALARPTSKTSKKLLAQKPQPAQISAAAASQVAATVQRLDQAQRSILPALTGGKIGGKVLFRAQRSYNGIAMVVSRDKVAEIEKLPGVKAVHPLHPKERTAAFSDIDFVGTRSFWSKAPFGIHGENLRVAIVDTGLDYVHTNFGGPGSAGYASVSDTSPVPNTYFPTQKIPGGIDLAGDNYNANEDPGTGHDPAPDPNPFDCNGHGTAVASLAAGYGVTNAGFTYAGSYDAAAPAISSLTIAPGYAPQAKLFPVRVFGCAGSTNLVIPAVEWTMDPNGDGNFSDRMDVVNMSLGADNGFADDPDAVACTNAAAAGIVFSVSAGNDGDTYYIVGGPSVATGILSVAATFNDQSGFISDASVTGNSPNLAGQKFAAIYADTSPHTSVTGDVVYARPPLANAPLTNAAQVAGNIVLIDRGGVTFAAKAAAAQAAGASGIIVVNNAGDPVVQGSTGIVTVPDVMISTADGATLKAAANFDAVTGVPVNPTNVTIAPDAVFVSRPPNPPGSAAGPGSPDTVPTYTSRGPRLPDSALKPDLAAPAEVTGVASHGTGSAARNFNGTSSAAPHVAGMMALIRQQHPTWSVQELLALACNTATHNLATTVGGTTLIGPGRIGSGRIDLDKASKANMVAFNGTDSGLIGVSFGVVEVPADGTRSLTKSIRVVNKGTADVTYNLAYQDIVPAAGTNFTIPASITVPAGTSQTFNVTFDATGSALRHNREASVGATQATGFGTFQRQFLTEKAGWVDFTPTSGTEPSLRVAVYAAPKPTAAMHATNPNVVPEAASGSFTVNLSGLSINTGASFPTDIVSLVKPFELQYASTLVGSPSAPTDPNVLKYVGVTCDWANRTDTEKNNFLPVVTFGLEGFGNAPLVSFPGSDKEIFIDFDFDAVYDAAVFLSALPHATTLADTNVYNPVYVDIAGIYGPPNAGYFWTYPTNAISGNFTNRDTNSFNNSAVTIPLDGIVGTGFTAFQYQVFTFDRSGNQIDQTPVLFFDAANPGLEVTPAATVDPFMLPDLASTGINVEYNGTGFQTNGSLGVLLLHMHNGTGNRSDAIAFRKPTVTGFSPTSGQVGDPITITGSNFGPGTVVTFFLNKVAEVTVITSNTLIAKVPAGAITGPITVSNAAGSSTAPGNFTVLP